MTLDDCRRFYAKEIQCVANLTSPALVEALATIPREKFMGPSPWQITSPELLPLVSMGLRESPYVTTNDPQDLYNNVLVALDDSRQLNIGHPSTNALWISALDLKPKDYVFHAGCGLGYYTAIMRRLWAPTARYLQQRSTKVLQPARRKI